MPPRRVGVGEPLALTSALRDEPLAVGKRGQVARVDRDVFAILRKLRAQGGDDRSEGCLYQGAMRAELRGEAVAGIHARRTSEGVLQSFVLRDQSSRSTPRRDRVEALGEAGTDQGADRVTLAPCPAKRLKLGVPLAPHPKDPGRDAR